MHDAAKATMVRIRDVLGACLFMEAPAGRADC